MINRCDGIKAMKRGILAVFLVLTISSASQAGPLGVKIDPLPAIVAGLINSTYIAATGAFTASGLALTLDRGPEFGPKTNINTSFRLTATINQLTGEAISGTLTIGTAGAPLLISNTLVGFAYVHTSGGALEFLFGGLPGQVLGSYVDSGPGDSGIYSYIKPVDVMLTGTGTAFQGHLNPWAANWSSGSNAAQVKEDDPNGNGTTVPLPEPSTLLLMLAGAGALCTIRKRYPASDPSLV